MKKISFKKFSKFAGVALLLFTIVNCGKDIKVGLKDLGEEADPKAIDQALNKVSTGATLETAKSGQVVHFESNYTVDLNPTIRQNDIVRTFKTKAPSKDDPSITQYFLSEDYLAYDVDGNVTDEKHSEVVYEMKRAIQEAAKSLAATSANPNEICGKVTEDSDGKKFDCIRYYNFRTVNTIDPVPDQAKARPNCGNIPGCKIPVTKIYFDRVKLLEGKFVRKEIFEISATNTVPYLFPDMGMSINYFCIATLYQSDEHSYFVNRCTVLRDLQL